MFPAGAGMNRWWLNGKKVMPNVPRWRGDEPEPVNQLLMTQICSPLARG